MPSPPTSPSSLFKDAVSTFLQSANHALSLAEESHKDDVARALEAERDLIRQIGELRQERDLAVQERFKAELAAERARGDADGWKAAVSKAEWTIDHQAETINLLRRESQQWKEQFMRVEEERCKLATRIDEMVTEQLHANRRSTYHKEPLTPRSQGPMSSSSNTRRDLSSALGPEASTSRSVTSEYVSDQSIPVRTSTQNSEYQLAPIERMAQRNSNAVSSTSVSSRNHRKPPSSKQNSVPAASHAYPKQVVLRRVHAVVEIPVKEESMETDRLIEDEEGASANWQPSSSVEHVGPVYSQRSRAAASNASAKKKRSQRKVVQDEDEDDADIDDDYVESAEEYEDRDRERDEGGGGSRQVDDEEDELMMGVEDDDSEVYGSERRARTKGARTPTRRAQTQPSSSKSAHSASSVKRRGGSPYPSNSSKKARKK